MNFLDIYNQDKSILKHIKKDINKIIKKSDYILGNKVTEFEEKFAKYCNVKYAVGCANGTDALYLAIKSLNLPKNSEVILPAMTYCSTVFAVIEAGYKPVLVDIAKNKSTLCIDSLKKKINSKTKLIIMVHLYGETCDYLKIRKIIKNKKIYLLEDAAQAHGAYLISYNKKIKAGSMGNLACFSFYPGKNLGAYGDAGIITTNNKKKYLLLKKLRNLGSNKKFFHDVVGINSRLDTIQAAILLKKINFLDLLNSKRKKIANMYNKLISNKNIIKLNYSKGCVFHQYVVIAKKPKKFRDYLKSKKIPFGRHYPFPIHKLNAVKKIFKKEKYEFSEKLSKNGISLPINPILKKKEILKVIKTINSFK